MKRFGILMKAIALTFVSLISFNSCAFLLTSGKEVVTVNSDPPECRVFVNGQYMGNTPLKLKLKSNQTHTVQFKREGYRSHTVHITKSIAGGFVILDILFGVVPLIVDAATGAWYTLDQDYIYGVLDEEKK